MKHAKDIFFLAPESELDRTSNPPSTNREIPDSTVARSREWRRGPDASERLVLENSKRILDNPMAAHETSGAIIPEQLRETLGDLARLIANLCEAYTCAIYLADNARNVLLPASVHTLSREFCQQTEIPFGHGLIGWTAEHKLHICVSPFERDARTLLCYRSDQALKSFIAVPILVNDDELLGVICCDSKKNYAFAKITEKLLHDCAAHATRIIGLYRELGAKVAEKRVDKSELDRFLDELRGVEQESALLNLAAELPHRIVDRDALVVVSSSRGGVGKGEFFSSQQENRIGHRLLELVCRHKKIICGSRSVHALPTDDIKKRSFLSVPIQVLGREAGSLNLLSRPHEAFEPSQITALEQISGVLGHELERIRLRDRFSGAIESTGISSWSTFCVRAESLFENAAKDRTGMSMVRIAIPNIDEIESVAGVSIATAVMEKAMRLTEQVMRAPSIACFLYGFQILVLTETTEAPRMITRLRAMLERLTINDFGIQGKVPGPKLGTLLIRSTEMAIAHYPNDGETLSELTAKTRRLLEESRRASLTGEQVEKVAHAGSW